MQLTTNNTTYKHGGNAMEKIRETKYNEWFRNIFLESFGHCKSKQISEKQGLIFEKYLKEDRAVKQEI